MKLIDATIECLRELGWAHTTTTRVARRAGLSLGAIQHHFNGKPGLILGAHDAALGDLNARLEAKVGAAVPLPQRCEHVVDALWHAYQQPSFMAALEIFLGTRGDARLHARLDAHRTRNLATYGDTWRRIFHDTGMSERYLLDLLQFALAWLRGWALLALTEKDQEFLARQKQLMSEFLLSRLASPARSALPVQARPARAAR